MNTTCCLFVCLFVQLEQYRLVSQSFEKRVLDLQKEIKSKDDEIAALQKADGGFQNSANHVRLDGWCQPHADISCHVNLNYIL